MGLDEKHAREGFERLVDERIRAALANLTQPFESRIRKLQKRVDRLKDRFQKLVHHADTVSPKAPID